MKIREFDGVKKFKFLPTDTDTNAVRLRELEWLAPMIRKDSYCMEFGVFSGTTINAVAKARPDLKIYGFDSFEGLPSDWDMGQKNVKAEAFDRKGEYPDVENNVVLVKGWFDKTVPHFKTAHDRGDIGYLHIDGDVYESAKIVLDELNDWIVPGTIIRFDELCCWRYAFGEASPSGKASRVLYTTWKEHEYKALNEWLDKYDRKVAPLCRNWFQGGTVIVTQ